MNFPLSNVSLDRTSNFRVCVSAFCSSAQQNEQFRLKGSKRVQEERERGRGGGEAEREEKEKRREEEKKDEGRKNEDR